MPFCFHLCNYCGGQCELVCIGMYRLAPIAAAQGRLVKTKAYLTWPYGLGGRLLCV